jgi:putative transcriptional regulator
VTHPSRATTGRLLLAQPQLTEANFERTVVFMLEHNDEGAVGVVINRPTDLRIAEVLADWRDLAADPAVLHVGGPVSQTSVLALGLTPMGSNAPVLGFGQVVGRIGTVDLNAPPEMLLGDLEAVRFFAGYSGWGAGQLDWELEDDSWFVVDAMDSDVLDPDPESLWRRVLQRQPDRLQLLAHYPPDVSVN